MAVNYQAAAKLKKSIEVKGRDPYLAALTDWQTRNGVLLRAGLFWRNACFFSLLVILGLGISIVALMQRRTEVPYVIALDKVGEAYAVGAGVPVAEDKFIYYHLRSFVRAVRSVSVDTFAMEGTLKRGYAYVKPGSGARNYLEEFHRRERKPFEVAKKVSIQVKNISFIRISNHTLKGRWEEVTRTHLGAKLSSVRYWGEFTYELFPETSKSELIKNPLGLKLTHLNWAKE